MSDLLLKRGAVISDCGLYRYRLSRRWGDGALLPFVMLNPSTADADIDDPTIRRCMGFARREGASGIVVVNLFGLRSTDPYEMASHQEPVGAGNADALVEVADTAFHDETPIVCAWGAMAFAAERAKLFISTAKGCGARLVCLGKTKDGSPRHPLYVRGDHPLEPFP
jgi:hypothetical protein